ncbi:MAG: ThuA domain-containing protein [Planctomycetota bacterium]
MSSRREDVLVYETPRLPGADVLPGRGKHIVLVAGDEEYRSEEALPMLARILAVRHGFRCTVLFSQDVESGTIDPGARGHIPGLAALDDADLMVLFTRFRRLPDADMGHIVDYVESGRPLIGIRTATHAFDYEAGSTSPYVHWTWNGDVWPGGFGRQVLGETWVAHYGKHGSESTRGVIAEAAAGHPILRGVGEVWGPTDVYTVRDLPDDAVVLLEGEVLTGMASTDPPVTDGRNEPRMPVTWLRERVVSGAHAQRIVCSTIGAAVDFADEDLRRLFVNACYWAVGLEARIPERAEVDTVGNYRPSMYGFGKHRRGVRVPDLELIGPTR